MSEPLDNSQIREETANAEITTRRRFLSLAIAGPVALAGTLGVGAYAFAKDGKDDDDDEEDNSGHGNSHDDDEDDHDDDSDDHGGDPHAQPAAEGVTTVEILDEVFVPNHIAIKTGQTVTWINRDDDDHTASGRGMDSGIMSTWRVRFGHISRAR